MNNCFRPRCFLPLLSLALISMACGLLRPSPPPETPGNMLFQDDFSDPGSGWNRVNVASGATDYADGMYRIWVNEPNLDVWARPKLDFYDVYIEVDALKVGGDRNNRFGVICRMTPDNEFYVFLITSDGYYGIGKVSGGQFLLLGDTRLQPSPAIHLGSMFNHIRAGCLGSSLALFVNGQKLVEVLDDDLEVGDVGLLAGSYASPGVDIRFDNFIVTEP